MVEAELRVQGKKGDLGGVDDVHPQKMVSKQVLAETRESSALALHRVGSRAHTGPSGNFSGTHL